MAFDINDRMTWAWKSIDTMIDTRVVEHGDLVPNPSDRHSFYHIVHADGVGSLRTELNDCPMESREPETRMVFNPEIECCDFSAACDDARIYERCLQKGWLERDER